MKRVFRGLPLVNNNKNPRKPSPLNHGVSINMQTCRSSCHFLCLLIIRGCSWRESTRIKLRGMDHVQEHVSSSVIMRETLLSRLKLFVLFFSGSAAPRKDRHNVAFLEQLVNMTLCPVEQKNASSPCPQRLARRSHWLHARSRRGATLVKSKQKSVWNTESHSKRQ